MNVPDETPWTSSQEDIELNDSMEIHLTNPDVETYVKEKDDVSDLPYQKQKFIALYKARTILASVGTMQERLICGKLLKQMKKRTAA